MLKRRILIVVGVLGAACLVRAGETEIVGRVGQETRVRFVGPPGLRTAESSAAAAVRASIAHEEIAGDRARYEVWCMPMSAGRHSLRDVVLTRDGKPSDAVPDIVVSAVATLPANDTGRIESGPSRDTIATPFGPRLFRWLAVAWGVAPLAWYAVVKWRRDKINDTQSLESSADYVAILNAFCDAEESTLTTPANATAIESAYWAAWQDSRATTQQDCSMLRQTLLADAESAASIAVVEQWLYGDIRPSLERFRRALRTPLDSGKAAPC